MQFGRIRSVHFYSLIFYLAAVMKVLSSILAVLKVMFVAFRQLLTPGRQQNYNGYAFRLITIHGGRFSDAQQ